MINYNPLRIIWHVQQLWKSNFIRQKDLDETTSEPVEAGDNLKTAVVKLQKEIDEILEIIGS